MIVAHVAMSLAFPQRSELLGMGRSRALAGIEAAASVACLACAFLASVVGIFALPFGMIAQGLIRFALLRLQSARLYRITPVRAVESGAGD
jgi:hypothetical protein